MMDRLMTVLLSSIPQRVCSLAVRVSNQSQVFQKFADLREPGKGKKHEIRKERTTVDIYDICLM